MNALLLSPRICATAVVLMLVLGQTSLAFSQADNVASSVDGIGTSSGRSMPAHCTITPVPVPPGVDPPCVYLKHEAGCEWPPNCTECSLFALQLDCDSCWVEDITFWFDPQDECFFLCGLMFQPTAAPWTVPPSRNKSCRKDPLRMTTPNPNQPDWVSGGIMVFKICRSTVGTDTLKYLANVYCPDYNDPYAPPIFHGSINGTVNLP